MAAAASRLLVLSSDVEGARSAVSELTDLCNDCAADAPNAATRHNATALTLQTKYYRAQVDVHVHVVQDNAPAPALQHELCDYEAVLVVVNAAEEESFQHVCGFATRVVELATVDVCLLLVSSTCMETTERVETMESWCHGNGFELVVSSGPERSCGDHSVAGEKHGVARVLEALQCNRWRSMEMHVRQTAGAVPLDVVAAESIETNVDEMVSLEDEVGNKEEHEEESCDGSEALRQETQLMQALDVAACPSVSSEAIGGGGESDDDVDMDEFCALIAQVRNVRDQVAFLDDTKRRERAAEVAMKLSKFLGDHDDYLDEASFAAAL
ncbi:unnamed protein product [Hyaloperonospora brassicae]|uniref:Uncharacterized protein n=1 Tax=Hyaloperonospora brassicae TaxID=162125 RepID=A0AAV0TXD8_HYABA|nr:unnamed protein product [Hyaloperonospora brassicae]